MVVPDDIKRDIAKVVRSIEWSIVGVGSSGGMCFYRAATGYMTLRQLGIRASMVIGGMAYRAGPGEYDIFGFCGPDGRGQRINGGILAHYFLIGGDDEIIDFSVGDWKGNAETVRQVEVPGMVLDPIRWTAPPLPDFFWGQRSQFQPSNDDVNNDATSPELGRAWYSGFDGRPPDWNRLYADLAPSLEMVGPLISERLKFFALKERMFAAREGHTAIRLSQLHEIGGYPPLPPHSEEHLFVLRGKVPVSQEAARDLLRGYYAQ